MPVTATLGRQPLAPPDTGAADFGRNRSGGEGADDRGIRLTRNITFALLLAVSFMGGGAHAASARNEAPPPGPTTSPHERGGRGNGVTRDLPSAIAESGDHGLPQRAVEIARPFGFPITNSMIVSWIVAVGLITFARAATRDMKRVPGGAQNLLEWLVGGLYDFLEHIIGPHLIKRTFWFFATVFIFILTANWVGLIPGVGTIGWGHQTADVFVVDRPLLRGANADLNLTLAMALVFFAAGCLEIVSIIFRPVSLSFRLYGNIFAGENMLEVMSRVVPSLGWLLPIPFYFMELLVGLVQALVFMLLCAVFTLLVCQHGQADVAVTHR